MVPSVGSFKNLRPGGIGTAETAIEVDIYFFVLLWVGVVVVDLLYCFAGFPYGGGGGFRSRVAGFMGGLFVYWGDVCVFSFRLCGYFFRCEVGLAV